MNARTSLECAATSAASARHFVAGVLSSSGFANNCVETAVLLTSEIVTNAVVHAKSALELVVIVDHPMARVQVFDADPTPPVPRLPAVAASRGRGMLVLDALAEAWGFEQLGLAGKYVWFEVRS